MDYSTPNHLALTGAATIFGIAVPQLAFLAIAVVIVATAALIIRHRFRRNKGAQDK